MRFLPLREDGWGACSEKGLLVTVYGQGRMLPCSVFVRPEHDVTHRVSFIPEIPILCGFSLQRVYFHSYKKYLIQKMYVVVHFTT